MRPLRNLSAVLASTVVLILSAGACSGDGAGSSSEQPEYVASASVYDFKFESLEEMAATADAVFMGTVEAVDRGRKKYTCDDQSERCEATGENYFGQLRSVTIAVDAQLGGRTRLSETVTLEEWGYDREGNPYEVAGAPWSRVGDRGAFFLRQWPLQPEGSYYLVHPVGRVLTRQGSADGSGEPTKSEFAVTFAEGDLSRQLRAVRSDELQEHVSLAVRTAEAEGIRPQEPLEWLETTTDGTGVGHD